MKQHRHRGKPAFGGRSISRASAVKVTDERTGNPTMFPAMEEYAERVLGRDFIAEDIANPAYDDLANLQLLDDKEIVVGIKIEDQGLDQNDWLSRQVKGGEGAEVSLIRWMRERHRYGRR